MATMQMHANRNLRPRQLTNGDRRGLPGYHAFSHGVVPEWWTHENDHVLGGVLGVYENHRGSPVNAIAICELGLVVLGDNQVEIRYSDIVDIESLSKDAAVDRVFVRTRFGDRFAVPLSSPEGEAFDFKRFLLAAVSQAKLRHG